MISAYDGWGVAQSGVTKSDHSIVFTGEKVPSEHPLETPRRRERGMHPKPVQIVPNNPTDSLTPMSRINYAKVYTIDHGVRIKPFGKVHRDSQVALTYQYQDVHNASYSRSSRIDMAPAHEAVLEEKTNT